MKKITLIASIIFSFYAGMAQSLTYSNATTPMTGLPSVNNLDATVTITNISANSVDVKVERITNNLSAGHASYFCWEVCYGETQSMSDSFLTIMPGANNYFFHGYVRPYGNSGVDTICYNFFNAVNMSDAVSVCFVYDFSTGIPGVTGGVINPLSEASPNPANNLTAVNYYVGDKKDARIIIYNLLGKVVREVNLSDKKGTMILSISDLNQGVYYYSLLADGKTLATHKLVVAHR